MKALKSREPGGGREAKGSSVPLVHRGAVGIPRRAEAVVEGAMRSPGGLLALQRSAGNRAVSGALSLQRAPRKKARSRAAGTRPVRELRSEAKRTKQAYDKAWSEFSKFEPIGYLDTAEQRIVGYLNRYGLAYGEVEKVLAKAKEAEARQKAFTEALQGIVIGAALGALTGGLGAGFQGVAGVLAGIADETLSATGATAVGKLQGGEAALDPPAHYGPTIVATSQWRNLAGVWKAVAKLRPAERKLANLRTLATDAAAGVLSLATGGEAIKTMAQYDADLRLLNSVDLNTFVDRLTESDRAVKRFAMAVDSPLLQRDPLKLEQDIWIKWIVSLAKERYDPRRGRWFEWTDEASDAIDADQVEGHLEKIGLIGPGSRLKVNFGADTDKSDTKKAAENSSHELALLKKVGQFGVVTYGGMADFYAIQFDSRAYGDHPIPPGGLEGVLPAKATEVLLEGEIARVIDTRDGNLLITPAPGKRVAVAPHEAEWGQAALRSARW